MSTIGTGYDLSASQFSPDGRVFQIDYASKAVEKSGTVIGIRGKDAVVLAVEKIITSKLYEPDAGGRIFTIEKNIGMAVAGLVADGNYVADIARQEAATTGSNLSRLSRLSTCATVSPVTSTPTLCTVPSAPSDCPSSSPPGTRARGTALQDRAVCSSFVTSLRQWQGQAAGKTEMEKLKTV
ncbi:GM20573 [Drosophila sechellia]|uniref:Proteasome subunit alpha type n=1 Tax=Drosophila sechellia TaxID=7238 RepID=B4HT55_DROSE|nr:GM20573 [Drosophila sechellia]